MAAELTQTSTPASSPLPAPILQTERIYLRPMHPQDAPSMVHHAGPASIHTYMSLAFAYPYTMAHAQEWIALNARDRMDNYVLTLPSNPAETIGSIGVKPGADTASHTGEIGYWLSEEYAGKGMTTEMLAVFTEWVFTEGKMNDGRRLTRLYAEVNGENGASMRVLEKCGYKKEGIMKGHLLKHGVVYDMHYYGLTKGGWEEWRKGKEAK